MAEEDWATAERIVELMEAGCQFDFLEIRRLFVACEYYFPVIETYLAVELSCFLLQLYLSRYTRWCFMRTASPLLSGI
jgi:hypothetical protein